MSLLWPSIFLGIPLLLILRHGEYHIAHQCLEANCSRAGCNFSALSASDAKALRWDRLGYAHLKKLANERPAESFLSHTPSTEMWDNVVPYDKIKDMSEYLEDVCNMEFFLNYALT